MTNFLSIDPDVAVRAVRAYNRDTYKGRLNTDIDREGYRLFGQGLSRDIASLTEQLHFIGEDYGAAQERFLPHGIRAEARVIATQLLPVVDRYMNAVSGQAPLLEVLPALSTLEFLFEPFAATKRWGVWASKTLHFLRPITFPVLDSRAKNALGVPSLGGSASDYRRFSSLFRDALLRNSVALTAAERVDDGEAPTHLKLLDKVLYEVGKKKTA